MNKVTQWIGRQLSSALISRFRDANLTICTPDGVVHSLGHENHEGFDPIRINDWSFFWDLLMGHDLGLAKSYLEKKWEHGNLPVLFRQLAHQADQISSVKSITLAPEKLYSKYFQRLRSSNSMWWASRNISAHYDMSNEFFENILDSSMTYSCGIFENENNSLRQAQEQKLDVLFDNSRLEVGQRILDIGCGWGGLITRASQLHGVHATGVTLSEQQYNYSCSKNAQDDLVASQEILFQDYRTISGEFDHIFSVEMLEAVGFKGIYQFFEKCALLLKKGGTIQIQVIIVPDERYESYRRNCDFIQKYIFPGGELPSLGVIEDAANKFGFSLNRSQSIGEDYVITLQKWRERLHINAEKIFKLGFSQRDFRRFDYYFSYCEGAFEAGHIDNFQLSYVKE
ncbi:MAG: cyclopropane-fatty-acyl-phospholipid synthase family protein [SAR202 cluster bacterium]|nr:cyclopropane-fatty-acyl-phospholipid synthase family protein [SAR202 cluster bacterium]